MTTLQIENKIGNTYLRYLKNLSREVQLDIIAKWSVSLNEPIKEEEVKPDSYFFGIWDSEQTAEEIIEGIKNYGVSTRKIIDLD